LYKVLHEVPYKALREALYEALRKALYEVLYKAPHRVPAIFPIASIRTSAKYTPYIVKTLYNDTVFFTVRIVILKVLLYLDFVRKTHQTLKLYNNIVYLLARS
jgi:hypothetical protein